MPQNDNSLSASNKKTNGKIRNEPMDVIQQISDQDWITEMNDNGESDVVEYYGKDEAETKYEDVKSMKDLNQYIQRDKDAAKCQLCDKTFTRLKSVRDHLAYKHFNYLFNYFTCQICGKNLSSRISYVYHMKKKHP